MANFRHFAPESNRAQNRSWPVQVPLGAQKGLQPGKKLNVTIYKHFLDDLSSSRR